MVPAAPLLPRLRTRGPRHVARALALLLAVAGRGVAAQDPPAGLRLGALPAVGYDADEGWSYGVLGELYQYGDGSVLPYRWTAQGLVEFSTEGKRDIGVFYDAPDVLPGAWRATMQLRSARHTATPFYGVGNDTDFVESLVTDADPRYYRFQRTRERFSLDLQHPVGGVPLRVLLGGGLTRVRYRPRSGEVGTTLLARELETGGVRGGEGWYNHLRIGLIWDTRDRETGPTSGMWTEILVQRVDELLVSEGSFTRWTVTDRRYVSLLPGLVYANRFLVQGTGNGAPFHELSRVQTSFKEQEGLGGAKTLRGVLLNRFLGRAMALWNAELRWRLVDLRVLSRSFHVVVSGFVDTGRVWEDDLRIGELARDLHHGYGGGLRVGMGPDFVVALDLGTSQETGAQVYIGLGYLY